MRVAEQKACGHPLGEACSCLLTYDGSYIVPLAPSGHSERRSSMATGERFVSASVGWGIVGFIWVLVAVMAIQEWCRKKH